MTDHEVRSLRLHLRSHGPPPADVETEARTFSERLLTAITERLDARANGKLVLVRRLPIRIRARRELFADRAELERIADDVAAAIPLERRDEPTELDDVVVFVDDVAWRTAYLADVARDRAPTAWWFSALASEPDGIAGLALQPRAAAHQVLVHLARAGWLVPLLERLPTTAIEQLASRFDIVASSDLSSVALPDVITARVRARLVRSILALVTEATPGPDRAELDAVETPTNHSTIAEDSESTSEVTVHRTRFGGLVYLVRGLVELDAGETLWRACVPESIVISAALAALVDGDDDPAPALFGGASPRERFEASAAQRDEIVRALLRSLLSALPRRGLAAPPELAAHVVGHRDTRVLAVFLGEYPVFASPVSTVTAAREALVELGIDAPLVENPRSLALRPDLSLDAALVIAVTGGCAAALAYARAGELALGAHARIHDEDDRRIVTMPMESIHLPTRRAGLDRDPGWIPWLQRRLILVFDE